MQNMYRSKMNHVSVIPALQIKENFLQENFLKLPVFSGAKIYPLHPNHYMFSYIG